jgi:hypothetical protein
MRSKKANRALFVSTLILLFSPVLAAKGLEHSYADVGYLKFNGDDYDLQAGAVDATFGVFDLMGLRLGFIHGGTQDYPKTEDPSGNPDITEFRVGARPHYSFGKNFDVYADLLYSNRKINGDLSHTDIGWIYAGGIRWQALKWAELNLAGEYRSGSIDAAFLVVNPVFKLTKNFDLSLKTSQSSDDADYFAGLRLKF